MPIPHQYAVRVLRILIALACGWGIWNSWKVARADYLLQQDTAASIRSAIQLAPDDAAAYMRLAQLDEGHALEMLETALRLDPYNAQADIELGLLYESNGDPARAEKLLLHAFEVDHTYTPRWSLANFYLRQDNLPAFWHWARRAAEMPPDDMGALFALCWRVSPDPKSISDAILNDNPAMGRQYMAFLAGKQQLRAAADLAPRLIRNGSPDIDRPLLLSLVNQAIAANDATAANEIWRELIQKQWVVADISVPNNPDFARDPLPVGFDWSLPSYTGLHSWPGPSGLAVEFTGDEPESCAIADQIVSLAPGNYTLEYAYRTSGIAPDTGIKLQILDAKSGAVLAESPNLSSDSMQHAALSFSVAQDTPLLRLHLGYQRALGTTRVTGTLAIQSTRIRPNRAG
jgi:tetratricopeptide (TPR) repeat protein